MSTRPGLRCLLWLIRLRSSPNQMVCAFGYGSKPRLASWMAAGHRDQVRLGAFLAEAEELTQPQCDELAGPLALSLDVGLPADTPLLEQHDLDNYVFP